MTSLPNVFGSQQRENFRKPNFSVSWRNACRSCLIAPIILTALRATTTKRNGTWWKGCSNQDCLWNTSRTDTRHQQMIGSLYWCRCPSIGRVFSGGWTRDRPQNTTERHSMIADKYLSLALTLTRPYYKGNSTSKPKSEYCLATVA